MRRSWLRLFWAGIVIGGVIVGYLVSSGQGERLLHQEIETQLSRLLAGPVEIERVELRFENGLRVEAHGLQAYPSRDPDGLPALRANRVLAWIDILAVLVGRLELSTLVLEGPQIRIEQLADGSFPALPWLKIPLESTFDSPKKSDAVTLAERVAQQLESLDSVATAFLEEFRSADRIEILDGAATWIDHRNLNEDGNPRELRLELIKSVATRDWLSDKVHFNWHCVFVDGQHTPFPIEIEVRRDEAPHFEWTASFSQIPLSAAETPLSFIDSRDQLAGTLDATFALTTSDSGTRRLRVDSVVRDSEFLLRRSGSLFKQKKVEIHIDVVVHKERLLISSGRVAGERLGFEIKGAIERPLGPRSHTRIESRMTGARIAGIRDLVRPFEAEFDTALAIARLTDRIEEGHIRYLEAAGTARFQKWLDLANGQDRNLPSGFTFGGAVKDIVFRTSPTEVIGSLSGEIEWVGDQITLREMNGIYEGQPLPELNVILEGVSHLIETAESTPPLENSPPPIPGIMPLINILKPQDPNSLPPVKAIGLAIDFLNHPLFRFPLRDLRILIEPLRNGMQLSIREGTWGGADLEGDLIWSTDSEAPSIDAHLTLSGPSPNKTKSDPSTDSMSMAAPKSKPKGRWGAGQFELEFRPRPAIPFTTATGFFRLDGSQLIGQEVEIGLDPVGKAAIRTTIDLDDPESVGLDLSFAITEATLKGMSEFIALPPDLATGDIGATGTLAGLVRPDTSFIAELDGSIRVEAKNGRIQLGLPLFLRLGKATEGYNPFSNADEINYETMTGTVKLLHGRLGIEDFELEGPLRVYANVRLDTNQSPGRIRAVVGIFLFRTPNQIFGNVPLLRSFLPGSERGLIGAYFKVKGPLDEPDIEALPLKTLMSSVPDAIKAPFKAMRFLFRLGESDS